MIIKFMINTGQKDSIQTQFFDLFHFFAKKIRVINDLAYPKSIIRVRFPIDSGDTNSLFKYFRIPGNIEVNTVDAVPSANAVMTHSVTAEYFLWSSSPIQASRLFSDLTHYYEDL